METTIKWHAYPEEKPAEEYEEYLVTDGSSTWVATYGTFRDGGTYDEGYEEEYDDEDLDIPETIGWYTKEYGMAIYWGNSVSVTTEGCNDVIAWTEFPVFKKEEF